MQQHNVEQRSPEWFALRNQYPLTASVAQAIGNNGKGLETLCWEKIAERNSSAEKEVYTNDDMARGVELEAQARSIYELEHGVTVDEVGFITNEAISLIVGASPDGLVGGDGLIEIKCPKDVVFVKLLFEEKSTGTFSVDSGYMWQMQMQLLVSEREWVDYVVYNPNFAKPMLVQRITKDEEMHEKLKVGFKIAEKFIKNIETKLK